ncbi:protein RKD4-like [Ipomoea triloba]|uniref:protein RKD4-like n=1 Tax=Ipomoea triloba TaxID=35885 RepID=UPI00125D2F74|nr:protein RKD4-like [Ipomoea triloba]
MVSKYFHLPMNQAVKELKIKEASLKKICKKVGIDELPYKKLRTLERLAKNVEGNTDHREIINELENQREQMLKDPNLQSAMNHLSTEENLMASSGILVQENTFPVASNASVGGNMTTDSIVVERSMIETLAHRQRKNTRRTFRDSSTISKEMISKYFHLPIYRAAKELRVGYTILKERCRELGIFKWPYRQLVSLEKLSGKAQVFSNIENDHDIKEAMKELKSRREMLLSDPNLKLNPADIRLRDSCTRKIKYREMMSLLHSPTLPIHPLHIPPLIVDPALPLTVDRPSLATEEDESFKLLLDGF